MKLLSLPQAPAQQQAAFFRHSWLGVAVVHLGLIALAGLMLYQYAIGEIPLGIMLVFVLASCFFMLFIFGVLVRSFKPTNWLLAVGIDRLWIKYRSYLNSHFPPDDLQVIELPYAEIESVGLIRRKEIVLGSKNRQQIQFSKHLEFTLRQPFGQELPEALQAERNAKDRSAKRIKSKASHYPVQVKGDKVFRVCISGIRPGWKRALRELETNGVVVACEKREAEDYTKPLSDKRQMEDQLIQLIEQGKTLAAVKLARQRYGMGLTEAKQFIDELGSR